MRGALLGHTVRAALLCAALHLLLTYAQLSNYFKHKPYRVCLFKPTHPAGFKQPAIDIAQTAPIDIALTAFFACLAQTRRIHDVNAGKLPHVNPQTIYKFFINKILFFPGTGPCPNLAALLVIPVTWTILYGGFIFCILSVLWALPVAGPANSSFCLNGWAFIVARTTVTSVEAALVTAGSFLMWSSKAVSLESHTARERAELSRATEAAVARVRASSFATLQWVNIITAIVVGLLALFAALFSGGTVHTSSWGSALSVALMCSLNSFLGLVLSAHHRRDDVHAARPIRPGVLLGVHLTFSLCVIVCAGVVSALSFATMPLASQRILQNWSTLQFQVLPFNDPLSISSNAIGYLRHIGISACVLALMQVLEFSTAVELLSRRGKRILLPPAIGVSAFVTSICSLSVSSGEQAYAACLVSIYGCAYARACLILSSFLALLSIAPLLFYPARTRARFFAYTCFGSILMTANVICALLAIELAGRASSETLLNWSQIETLVDVNAYACSNNKADLFGAAATVALNSLGALAIASAFNVSLLILYTSYDRQCFIEESKCSRPGNLDWNAPLPDRGAAKRLRFESDGNIPEDREEPLLGEPGGLLAGFDRACLSPRASLSSSAAASRVHSPGQSVSHTSRNASGPATPVRAAQLRLSRDTENTGLHDVDDQPIRQILLSNAASAARATKKAARRIAKLTTTSPTWRVFFGFLVIICTWVLAMCVLDSTAAADIAHVRKHTIQNTSITVEVDSNIFTMCDPSSSRPLSLRIENRYSRARTQIHLAPEYGSNLTVNLTVSSIREALAPPIVKICGILPNVPCVHGDAHIIIQAAPISSCNQECAFWWLWYPCRCHAASDLIVTVPRMHNLTGTAALINLLADLDDPRHCLPSVEVVPANGQVSIVGNIGKSQLLSNLLVNTTGGDVLVKDVVILGGNLSVLASGGGNAKIFNTAAPNIEVDSASFHTENIVAGSPCLYKGPGPAIGGNNCPNAPNGTSQTPSLGVLLGEVTLTGRGRPMMLNGSIGASLVSLKSEGGSLIAAYDLEIIGQLHVLTDSGVAHFSNTITLGCGVCMNPHFSSIGLRSKEQHFGCFAHCNENSPAVTFESSGDGSLSTALLVTPSIRAITHEWGDLTLSETLLIPATNHRSHLLQNKIQFAHIDLKTHNGDLAVNGLLTLGEVAQILNCSLNSYGGNIKALFNGAVNGSYATHVARIGIGQADIVIDNVPVHAHAGILGHGAAHIETSNSFGDTSLSFKTKAPNLLSEFSTAIPHNNLHFLIKYFR